MIREITRDPEDIKRIASEYSNNSTPIWQLKRNRSIPKKHKPPQLTQDEIDNLNSPKTIKEKLNF